MTVPNKKCDVEVNQFDGILKLGIAPTTSAEKTFPQLKTPAQDRLNSIKTSTFGPQNDVDKVGYGSGESSVTIRSSISLTKPTRNCTSSTKPTEKAICLTQRTPIQDRLNRFKNGWNQSNENTSPNGKQALAIQSHCSSMNHDQLMDLSQATGKMFTSAVGLCQNDSADNITTLHGTSHRVRKKNDSENVIYIVPDTNVFLYGISCIEDAIRRDGMEIFVPFIVLQELDRIKKKNDPKLSKQATFADRLINIEMKSEIRRIQAIAYDRRMRMVLERRLIRDITNPFDVPEREFINSYRLPQYLARALIREIEPFAEHIPKGIPFYMQVLCALNFYAGGSYQRRVGRDAHNYVSQSIVSRSIRQISIIISTNLGPRYIHFPQTPDEIESVKKDFYNIYGVQGVIGLIDCTHVPLTALKNDIEIAYVNRKGYHSLNVQIIGDARNLIRNINSRYPGSAHDSFIWGNSKVFSHLQSRYSNGVYDEFLFGDSGYPLEPWLIVPITTPEDEIDVMFNRIFKSIRSGIERNIALWKGKFRCLSGENKLRYKPLVVTHIVNSCAVLHNFLIMNNFPLDYEYYGEEVPIEDALPNEYYDVGHDIRRRLAEQLYY